MLCNSFNLFLGVGMLVCLSTECIAGHAALRKNDRVLAERLLPPLDGTRLRATLIKVSYAPGIVSPPHTHGCPVLGYVLKGTIRFQTNKDPEVILDAGDTFYERPNSIHNLSPNASKREGAKFLAFFVCSGDQHLSMPTGKGEQGAR